jgi:probable HAF family extracellular repeat protein
MTDLGPGLAFAINSAGQVVGEGEPGRAVIWEKGTITDLGTLGGSASYAYGINPAGQVVGESWTMGDRVAHAFLWEKGVMTDLGAPVGAFSRALAINPAGQVVGESTADGGPPAMTASLWTRKKARN